MSKNIKRILIAGGAVVVFALAFIVLKYVFPEEEAVIPDELVSASPAATETPVYYVVRETGNDVVQFKSTYSNGETFVIDIDTNENGSYQYTATPDDTFFGYNTSKFRSMMYTLTSLTATALIEEDPEDLSVYGLDNPQFTIEITFKGGETIRLSVGNMTPVARNYYVITDKDNIVYTIGNYLGSLLMREPYEFRNISTFPTYTEEDIYTNIKHFALTRRGGTTMEVWLDSEFTMEGNKSSSVYMMTSPVVSSCADDKIEVLLENLATISFSSIVGDIYEEDFKAYGFDQPARMVMDDIAGNHIDIVVGNDSSGSAYCCLGTQYDAYLAGETDYLTVLTYTETDFSWCTINPMTYMIRAMWIINIHDVSSLKYDLNGEIFDMELSEYDGVTGSGVAVKRVTGSINGKDITETNTKRIFSRTLNFREVNTLSDDIVYEENYTHSITVNMKDGTQHVMTFHKINERQYACIVDGVAEYYCYAGNMETLTTAISRAMDDREVSLVYTN